MMLPLEWEQHWQCKNQTVACATVKLLHVQQLQLLHVQKFAVALQQLVQHLDGG
jgi:hypothetical protein